MLRGFLRSFKYLSTLREVAAATRRVFLLFVGLIGNEINSRIKIYQVDSALSLYLDYLHFAQPSSLQASHKYKFGLWRNIKCFTQNSKNSWFQATELYNASVPCRNLGVYRIEVNRTNQQYAEILCRAAWIPCIWNEMYLSFSSSRLLGRPPAKRSLNPHTKRAISYTYNVPPGSWYRNILRREHSILCKERVK